MFKKSFWAFFAAALLMANGSVAEAAEITAIPEAQVMETSVSGGDVFADMVEEVVLDSGTVEVEVLSTSTDLTISSDYTLSEDTSVAGDLTITGGTVNLNGYTLSVGGDVVFSAGTLDINNGRLEVVGNFSMGSAGTVGTTRQATSTGVLVMDDEADVVAVGGNYEICSAYKSTLIKGTMYIGGDFAHYGTYSSGTWIQYANAYAFNASSSHKVVFSDGASHRIFFESTYSGFNEVVFGNGEIEIQGAIRGATLCGDAVWKSDVPDKQYSISGTMDLNGYMLIVDGGMNLVSGTIDINKGCLQIKGNLNLGTIGEMAGYLRKATSSGILVMDNAEDRVVVEGDFVSCTSGTNVLTNGTMYMGEDFAIFGTTSGSSYANSYSFNASGLHKVIFKRDVPHYICFESTDSGFKCVDFGNGDLSFGSALRGFTLEEDTEWNLEEGKESVGFFGTLDLNGHSLIINGNMNLTSGAIDINKGCLQIKGNLNLGTVGDMVGYLRYATSTGTLVMDDAEDRVVVESDFVSCTSGTNVLTNGTMYVGEDFGIFGTTRGSSYANSYSFNASGLHKVIFKRDVPHYICFESTDSGFKRVDFGNGALSFGSVLRGFVLEEDTEWNLEEGKESVGFSGTLDLNGHSLIINGDMNLTSGSIDINGGCLETKGSLGLGTVGEQIGYLRYATSTGALVMDDADDRVVVGGAFVCCTSSKCTLTDGAMYIKGSFAQYGRVSGSGYANSYSFCAKDKHTVLLCGTEPQSVYFEGDESKFNVLVYTQSWSNYTFNRSNCWNTLIDEAAPTLTVTEPSKEAGSLSDVSATIMVQADEKVRVGVYCLPYKNAEVYTVEQVRGLVANWKDVDAGENAAITINGLNSETKYGYIVVAVDGYNNTTVYAVGLGDDEYGMKTFTTSVSKTTLVKNFVERMYTVAFNRASDPSGVAYWTDVLIAKEYDGASLSTGFILGEEFTGKNYSNDEFIKVLYNTFFSREADEAGKAYWSGLLESGSSRASVLAGFVNSNEFFALCGEYGISRGMLRGDGSAINPGIYQFAERLYSKIFERNGDKDGIEYWTMQIDSRESAPENAAMGFFFSQEYMEKNTSDDDYIKALYRTFMGREADNSGLTYWKGEMANGATRAHVLSSFAQSNEFKGIMAEYGL